MNRNNFILSLLAGVQTVIIALVFWASARPVEQSFAPLVSASSQDISAFTLSDDNGQSLSLNKLGDIWVLADSDNFPADEFRVASFLNNLSNLSQQGLIARNANSYDRLSVADNNFVRKIELVNESGKDDVIYLGTSPRASAVHLRTSSSPNVYLSSDLRSSDLSTAKSAWIDTSYLSFSVDEVTEVNLRNNNGSFSFRRFDNTWTMLEQPEGDKFDPEKLTGLLQPLANLRMQEPLKLISTNAYGTNEPAASIEIKIISQGVTGTSVTENSSDSNTASDSAEGELSETIYTFLVGNALDTGYAVKASTSDYVVSVGSFAVENLINYSSEDFMVQDPPEEP